MADKTTQDMGTGSIRKLMVRMAVPAVLAQVINLLYNIVDRIYIGHVPEIGGLALTGVGLFTPILMLLTAFAMLAGAGGAPLASIAMGRGDREKAEQIMGNCFTVLLLLAALLTVVFYCASPTLLRLFGASDATLPYAVQYGRVYVLGSVFVLIVMGMNTFITTQGFAKTSMLTTVIGAAINIVLDPIFIFVLGLGVTGAALATILSQAVSALWILRFLTGKKTVLKLQPRCMKLDPGVILPCLGLGAADLFGRRLLGWLPDQLPAGLYGLGPGKDLPVYGLPAKADPAHSPDLHSAAFLRRPGDGRIPGRTHIRYSGRRHHHSSLFPLLPQAAEKRPGRPIVVNSAASVQMRLFLWRRRVYNHLRQGRFLSAF